jgi:hypothetical protein
MRARKRLGRNYVPVANEAEETRNSKVIRKGRDRLRKPPKSAAASSRSQKGTKD